MRATIVIALLVLLAVCASMRVWRPQDWKTLPKKYPFFKRQVLPALSEEADDEESDFWMALAPLAINLIKNKLSKKRDAVDEDDEEADKGFLDRVRRQFGIDPSQRVYNYDSEEEEEADAEFFKNLLKKVGGIALQAGKAYVGSKYGIQLDEEEESDFINWKKIGDFAKNVGKQYIANKYGVQLDEQEEEADFINWKKIGGIAKDIGKTYLSSKYGINLDEEVDAEEESDSALSNGQQLQATTVVNVRNGPCTSNARVGEVGAGSRVTYRGETKSGCGYTWYKIDQGWVASNYFTTVSSQPSQPAPVSGGSDCGESYSSGSPTGRKQCVNIDGKPVVTSTAAVFNQMKAAAASAGVTLRLNSGFRTQAEQQYLYNCYLNKNCNNGNLAARPGYSNHQNGIALDINVSSGGAYNWLVNNASKFGFVRTVASETWHWELRNSRCNAFVSYSCH